VPSTESVSIVDQADEAVNVIRELICVFDEVWLDYRGYFGGDA